MIKSEKIELLQKNLITNALSDISDAINNIDTKPRDSVIKFYSGLELIFKARLLKEHWTLVLSNLDENGSSYDTFVNGDFNSVTLETASNRIYKLLKNIDPSYVNYFNNLKKCRNKLIHFASDDYTRKQIKESLRSIECSAWYYLYHLLKNQWVDSFKDFSPKIQEIEDLMKKEKNFFIEKSAHLKKNNCNKYVNNPKYKNLTGNKCIFCDQDILEEISNEEDVAYFIKCNVCENHFCALKLPSLDEDDEALFISRYNKSLKDNTQYNLEYIINYFNEVNTIEYELYFCTNCEEWSIINYNRHAICLNCQSTYPPFEPCRYCNEYIDDSSNSDCPHCDMRIPLLNDLVSEYIKNSDEIKNELLDKIKEFFITNEDISCKVNNKEFSTSNCKITNDSDSESQFKGEIEIHFFVDMLGADLPNSIDTKDYIIELIFQFNYENEWLSDFDIKSGVISNDVDTYEF